MIYLLLLKCVTVTYYIVNVDLVAQGHLICVTINNNNCLTLNIYTNMYKGLTLCFFFNNTYAA